MHIRLTIIALLAFLSCKEPFSPTVETVLALPLEPEVEPQSVVFITGFDQGGNSYYTHATNFFADKGLPIVDTLFSLEEIIEWLNQKVEHRMFFNEIHIVSHGNPWLGISLRTTRNGERITVKTLREAIRTDRMPKMRHALSSNTKVIFHSCGLGENKELLKELKHALSSLNGNSSSDTNFPHRGPQIYASPYFNVFGGKYAAHYLAKPYFGFHPTGNSKGPLFLSEAFQREYPEIPIDWFAALKTRNETESGVPYSYTFNIPVSWEFVFDDASDIPQLEDAEAIQDFVAESSEMAETLYGLNIPLEQYRWKSETQGNKLFIHGKTTVCCVLAPILQDDHSSEYRNPKVNDRSLYQIF